MDTQGRGDRPARRGGKVPPDRLAQAHPHTPGAGDSRRPLTTGPKSIPYVLLVCSGLEHARRGFETFARECFEVLREDAGVRIELVKGSGEGGEAERAIPTLRRDRAVATAVNRIRGTRPFRVEALAFAFTLQPLLLRRRPDVVYFSEWDTGRGLAAVRALTRQQFKLLLCNGTLAVEGFDHLDHVQELTPAAREYVLERGADPARHSVLPLGFRIPPALDWIAPQDRAALRRRLDLPTDRRIVLSVAALNRYHKRLDYLIEEVARLPEPRPFVLLVGENEPETPSVRSLAHERLGEDGYSIRSVPPVEVSALLRASDVFVLASLWEGLPRALIEASAHGLPCLVHSYPVTDYALGVLGYGSDFTKETALAAALSSLSEADLDRPSAAARHREAYDRFSWDRLKPRYVELLRMVAEDRRSGAPSQARAERGKLERA